MLCTLTVLRNAHDETVLLIDHVIGKNHAASPSPPAPITASGMWYLVVINYHPFVPPYMEDQPDILYTPVIYVTIYPNKGKSNH